MGIGKRRMSHTGKHPWERNALCRTSTLKCDADPVLSIARRVVGSVGEGISVLRKVLDEKL